MRTKKQKWLIRGVIAFVILGLSFILFVNNMSSSFDRQKADAIRLAKKQAELEQIDRVTLSALDKKSIVVVGRDKHDQRILCWLTEGKLEWEFESDGTTEKQLRQRLIKYIPHVKIKHINPILFQGDFAWEAYIDLKQSGTAQTQYLYFDFRSGKKLATYTMQP